MIDVAAGELDRVHERIAGRFGRAEPRARVRKYVSGLVAGLERKNGWTLAERAGEVSPDGMQRLLRRADWDVDGVRDDVRDYVIEHLGDAAGVLIADETGFIKKGIRSAGVQRQYSGTAGRTENCQVGTFLAYASVHGHALIDRELYLPQSWAEDQDRRRARHPGDGGVHYQAAQAKAMISRAIEAKVPFAWFTADEVYGQAKYLQAWLEEQDVFYVMAIRRSDTLTTSAGEQRADALITAAPARSWQRISVVPVRTACGNPIGPVPVRPGGAWPRALAAARRSLHDPDEIAYYACYAPAAPAPPTWPDRRSRWHIEDASSTKRPARHYQSVLRPRTPHHLVHACPPRSPPAPSGKRAHQHPQSLPLPPLLSPASAITHPPSPSTSHPTTPTTTNATYSAKCRSVRQ